MDSGESSSIVFEGLNHSLRRSMILALRSSNQHFSNLMRSCGLHPDHDSGLFVYHLSQLVELGIIERGKDGYNLTSLGERIRELIQIIERESAFLMKQTLSDKRKEVKDLGGDISIQWFELEKMVKEGILYKGWEDFLPKMTEEQKKRYTSSKRWAESRENKYLLALRDEKPLAHFKTRLLYRFLADAKTHGQITKVKNIEPHLTIENLSLRTTESDEREKAVIELLNTIEKECKNIVQKILVYQVNAEDEAVISAFKKKGYQKFATTYIMTKDL